MRRRQRQWVGRDGKRLMQCRNRAAEAETPPKGMVLRQIGQKQGVRKEVWSRYRWQLNVTMDGEIATDKTPPVSYLDYSQFLGTAKPAITMQMVGAVHHFE